MGDEIRYGIAVLGIGAISYAAYKMLSGGDDPPAPACTNGQFGCIGFDKYECINGKWVLVEENSPYCNFVCKEGSTGCVVHDKYICHDNRWILYEKDSPDCGFVEECAVGSTKCEGNNKFICEADWWTGKTSWVLLQANSPDCMGALPMNYVLIPGNKYRMLMTYNQTISDAGKDMILYRAYLIGITDSISVNGGMVEWFITNTSTDTVIQVLDAALVLIQGWLREAGMETVDALTASMWDI